MSDPPPPMTPAERRAHHTGTLSLVLWLVIVILLGLGIGLWSPWKQRHTPEAPRRLVSELTKPELKKTAYLQLVSLGEKAGPELHAALQDPQFPARADVIELLGRIRYRPAVPTLVALKEPRLERQRLTALGNIGGPEALAALRGALQGENIELHFVALRKLKDWPEPLDRALQDEIMAFLSSKEFGLREFAALACGRQRNAQAVTPLIKALGDEHGDVRQAAGWALSQIGDEEGLKAVERAYASGAITESPQ